MDSDPWSNVAICLLAFTLGLIGLFWSAEKPRDIPHGWIIICVWFQAVGWMRLWWRAITDAPVTWYWDTFWWIAFSVHAYMLWCLWRKRNP